MSHPSASPVADGHETLAGRFLTFRCGNESYGIRALAVREIIRHAPVTAVPQLPAHLLGVINLRGRIVPVVDLKRRFGLGAAEIGDRTCVVVVQCQPPGRNVVQIGLVVDAVEEVVQIAPADVAPTPDFGLAVDTSFLLGMAKVKDAVKSLLNLEYVITGGELDELAALTPSAASL